MNPTLHNVGEALGRLLPAVEDAVPAAGAGSGGSVTPAPATPATASQPAKPAVPVAGVVLKAPGWRWTEVRSRGCHVEAAVLPGQLVEVVRTLDGLGFAIDAVTGVDWMAAGEMEVVYDFYHPTCAWHVVVRCRVPREAAEVPTVSGIYPGANWHERETHEFFGIRFSGHPDLSPLLLPEDADYHPLRKDFAGAA